LKPGKITDANKIVLLEFPPKGWLRSGIHSLQRRKT